MIFSKKTVVWSMAGMLGIPSLSTAAFQYFDPTGTPPATLTATGLYTDPGDKSTIDPAAIAYTPNAPLWSDGALKKRWIILPPGRSIPWVDDTDLFDYPDSTVFIKTFLQVRGPADTAYWETRILMRKADTATAARVWYGFSYRWNLAQDEAQLVDPLMDFDTAFSYINAQGRTTYKKWRFPSSNCTSCHKVYSGYANTDSNGIAIEPVPLSRAPLGFMPAQLKRPTAGGASNQVLDLFAQGVFSGTPPNAAQLGRRYIGMHEPIPPGLTPAERWMVLDTMARAYLAIQCSGCHGGRAVKTGGAGRVPPNFDYYDFRQHDQNWDSVSSGYLNDTTPYTDPLTMPQGRAKYQWLVSAAGMSTDPNWSLVLPPGDPTLLSTYELYRGYPSMSNLLFKQWERSVPAVDSASMYQNLMQTANNPSDPDYLLAINRLSWIFAAPWGSQQWLDTLAAHGFNLDSVMAGWLGYSLYGTNGGQMPPLGTSMVDTAAMKILGEWVVGPILGINSHRRSSSLRGPSIRNRTLFVPQGWTGKASMLDIRGRIYPLQALGNGRYAMPAGARPGIYFFRVGPHYFKASMF